jgi:geranylgeranyl diphosphate synthase type II
MEKPLIALLQDYISHTAPSAEPQNLYEPVNYMLSLGGKRIRPLLCLTACSLFGKDAKIALPAAAAVEWFHNFSLLHDDIMDKAETRRGKATVQQRNGLNVAILSGDVMLVKAYQFLENYPAQQLAALLKLFNQTAIAVCEGQQYDMDFETASNISMPQYIQMISLKTAVLLAASLQMGAIVADADMTDARHIYEFGRNIGIAFQLQDDILDTFGNEAQIGKRIGGDILNNKKTCLLVAALHVATGSEAQQLQYWLQNNPSIDETEKISAVTHIFEQLGVLQMAQSDMKQYYTQAFAHLNAINVPDAQKQALHDIVQTLMGRVN